MIPVQHALPARQKRFKDRAQAVLTPTLRAPLYGTPAVPQLRANLDRGQNLQGEALSIQEGFGEDDEEQEENSVEEEESYGTEGFSFPVWESQGTVGPTLAQYNKPTSYQSEPSLLAIMPQRTQIMANLKSASSSEASRPLAFKTSDCF
ncbi:hypothetical protein O181_116272 [Austropuccinia psidii MF-1]|uniref:Uncharacterized protein n=1 Tax=Austropuccinia psidii MF-1 TaxID=1389203 RepID=A0A9Q3KB38_9BASI|nr:hypothetical protein [Austropuccinia psidii MF-1]